MLHLKLIRIIGSGDNDLLFIAYSMKQSLVWSLQNAMESWDVSGLNRTKKPS